MNSNIANMIDADARTLLESFVVENEDLERLEQLLGQFNIFEVIGAVRHELRHSDFLGYLLDPRQNHGLGDEFTRLLLQKALSMAGGMELPISLIDLDVWNLTEIEVSREWQNIDILLIDGTHRLAVIIENKIGSSEHSNQLQRYREIIDHHYPGWNVVGILLTPEGDMPTDDRYISLDYTTICKILESLTEKRASTLGGDVRTLMTHYTQMLRRHIVSESEIVELCRRIYKKHKQALDLIFEHRPNEQAAVIELVRSLIESDPALRLDRCAKTLIRFAPARWYEINEMSQGQGWTQSGQIMLFEVYAEPLKIVLWIGPGPVESRQKLMDMALNNNPPFRSQSKTLKQKWNSVFRKNLLSSKDSEDSHFEDLQERVEKAWRDFASLDLPKIMSTVEQTMG
ncbi:MAG: PD-(D/E)XK nuclease family protein [Acidobacteria bacterium]|nr:PD-(D/E)XK nuclease family protein [Acidobacteriota bacterium]